MSLDVHTLFLRQARGFLEHRSGDGQFPDVMQQRRTNDTHSVADINGMAKSTRSYIMTRTGRHNP
jgi:hypothetical protein